MASNYPTSLDNFTNPNTADPQNNPSHSGQHADANDAIEALQAKVGADSSVVETSHDYKLGTVTGSNKAETQANKRTSFQATPTDTAYASEKLVKDTIDTKQAILAEGAFVDGDKTKLDGIEENADVTDATNIASSINGATAKTTLVDADTVGLIDSEDSNILKKLSWSNIKATLKTYFDTLYQSVLTFGIADNNAVEIDSADVADNDYAKFTPNGLEGRSYSEVRTDLNVADGATANSKATGAELDTGTDDAKFATAKALADSKYKTVVPRVSTEASSATPTINTDNVDAHSITALATAITSMTTNLSGTPTNFQKLIIRIKDNGTARTITWGASFEAKGVELPTTTTISKVLTVGFIYDTVTSKFGCVAVAEQSSTTADPI
jgi:hypothetical protein